jgi:primosomal protein N' (replication factor Y)
MLRQRGLGTQQVERLMAERFPSARVARMDVDTTSGKWAHAEILDRVARREVDVLLGTQMIAKGHHFSGVALAAVVDADTGLGMPDFRAEERSFQLVTQLAGRSGREAPGRVVVQTFQPDAEPLRFAARHDVDGFLARELERRRELGYPPFRHLVRILATGATEAEPLRLLEEIRRGLRVDAELLGPAQLLRLRGRYRAQLVAKTERPRQVARQAAHMLSAAAVAMAAAKVTAVVDVDPQEL